MLQFHEFSAHATAESPRSTNDIENGLQNEESFNSSIWTSASLGGALTHIVFIVESVPQLAELPTT